jgi:hypothetical protein
MGHRLLCGTPGIADERVRNLPLAPSRTLKKPIFVAVLTWHGHGANKI